MSEISNTGKSSKTGKSSERTRGRYRGFRLRERNGRLHAEYRLKEHGNFTIKFEKGTSIEDANKIANERLREIQSAHISTIESKTLKQITVRQLISIFLDEDKYGLNYLRKKIPGYKNEAVMARAFLRREKKICDCSLSQTRQIRDAFNEMILRRQQNEEIVGFSITRECSIIRTVFRHASDILFSILGYNVDVANPTTTQAGVKWPKDISGRTRVLKDLGDDLKIYKAIEDEFKTNLHRRKWLTLVTLALTTALRRGVILNLKWEDIDHEHNVIRISPKYWNGGKRAPPMVPLTTRLATELKLYYNVVPETERRPKLKLFPNSVERKYSKNCDGSEHEMEPNPFYMTSYIYNKEGRLVPTKASIKRREGIPKSDLVVKGPLKEHKPSKSVSWFRKGWDRIIERTDLVEIDTETGKQDWFHFNDLRHTATTRYGAKPYKLTPVEYGYLLGHVIGRKQPETYHNPSLQTHYEINEDLKEKIEAGDMAMAKSLGNGMLLDPLSIASLRQLIREGALPNILADSVGPMPNAEQWKQWKENAKAVNESKQ